MAYIRRRRGRHHDSKVAPKRDRKYLKKNNIFLPSNDNRLPVDCKPGCPENHVRQLRVNVAPLSSWG
jgi:hypothetical protein